MKSRIAQTLLGIIIASIFLYLAFRDANISLLWSSLSSVNYLIISLLIPITIISHWVRALRWKYLLEPVKSIRGTRTLFSAVMIGYLINNFVPRLGEIARSYSVSKLEGVSKSAAFGSVVIERIIDLVTYAFMLSTVLFFYPRALDPFISNGESAGPFLFIWSLALLALLILFFLFSRALFGRLKMLLPLIPEKLRHHVERVIASFLSGMGFVSSRERFGLIIFHSMLIWFLYAVGVYVPFFAFPDLLPLQLDFGAAVVLLTVSSFSFLLPSPGAFGTYHTFVSVALIQIFLADQATALSYAIVTHSAGLLITVAVGLYALFRSHLHVKEITSAETGTTGER